MRGENTVTTKTMKTHPMNSMYPPKVYAYALQLLDVNPKISAKKLQHDISYFKDVPKPPLATVAYWHAHPEKLQGYYEESLRRQALEDQKT